MAQTAKRRARQKVAHEERLDRHRTTEAGRLRVTPEAIAARNAAAEDRAAYAAVRDAADAHDRALAESVGEGIDATWSRRWHYQKAMKANTGTKSGFGWWTCPAGHRHKTTANCEHAKTRELIEQHRHASHDGTGSTISALPHDTVAGVRITRQQKQEWA